MKNLYRIKFNANPNMNHGGVYVDNLKGIAPTPNSDESKQEDPHRYKRIVRQVEGTSIEIIAMYIKGGDFDKPSCTELKLASLTIESRDLSELEQELQRMGLPFDKSKVDKAYFS